MNFTSEQAAQAFFNATLPFEYNRLGQKVVEHSSESDTARPGLSCEFGQIDAVRLVFRDGQQAHSLFVPQSDLTVAFAAAAEATAPLSHELCRAWETP